MCVASFRKVRQLVVKIGADILFLAGCRVVAPDGPPQLVANSCSGHCFGFHRLHMVDPNGLIGGFGLVGKAAALNLSRKQLWSQVRC